VERRSNLGEPKLQQIREQIAPLRIMLLINAIFFRREPALICFSRAIASFTSTLYRAVTPGIHRTVFADPPKQIIGYPGTQHGVPVIGQDVDEVSVRHWRELASSLRSSQ
jgi:hypothetical protein